MIVGGEVRGGICLQNLDRTDAFSDGRRPAAHDAGGKPDRRPRERAADRRDAAPARRGRRARRGAGDRQRVQDGLARRLDMQAMYDLVGDTVIEIFDAQVVDIGILDPDADCIRFPVHDRARASASPSRRCRSSGSVVRSSRRASHCSSTRTPRRARSPPASRRSSRARSRSRRSGRRSSIGDVAIGVISIQNLDREGAFSDRDLRLITTLASSLSVALENARLSREAHRRADEMAALADIGREISAHARSAGGPRAHRGATPGGCSRRTPAPSSWRRRTARVSRDHSPRASWRRRSWPTRHRARRGHHRRRHRRSTGGSSSTTSWHDPRTVTIPGTEPDTEERLMAAPLIARESVARGDGRLARRELGEPFTHERPRPAGRPVAARRDRHRERPTVPGRPGGAATRPRPRTRPRARSSPR